MRRHQEPIEDRVNHGEFRPVELIDEGGMGSIIEVEESQTGRPVALKVMHPEMLDSEEATERFYLEGRVLARLEHPNIVPLHVLKTDVEGRPFYTMKKVAGQTLQHIISSLRRGDAAMIDEYPLDRLVTVFYKICDAIAFAHSRGVVHRDLKPANIMVGEFGEVLVMDWGLAKVLGEEETTRVAEAVNDGVNWQDAQETGSMTISAAAGALTREGSVMGTPQYMSPEQATGRISDIDGRSDVFALGGILYAILTLHPPFFGDDVRQILSKVVRGEYEDPVTFMHADAVAELFPKTSADFALAHCPFGRIPGALAAVAEHAMTVDQDKRYQSVQALQADIDDWREGYATAAEKAGVFRQLVLLIQRNVIASTTVILVFCLAAGFAIKNRRARYLAEQSLVEAQRMVPMIADDARALIRQGKFSAAVKRLDQCLELKPRSASYLELKGNMYQSLSRFAESIPLYEQALEIDPGNQGIKDSLKKSRELAQAKTGDARTQRQRLESFRRLLNQQGRTGELTVVNQRLDSLVQDVAGEVANYRRQMRQAGAPREVASRLSAINNRLTLNLSGLPVADLAFLKNVPVQDLNLSGTRMISLNEVKRLPLQRLAVAGLPINSVAPLKGMKLQRLDLSGTRVTNINVLSGMPLQNLDLSDTPVTDIRAVASSELVGLHIDGCDQLKEIRSLPKARLRVLTAAGVPALKSSLLTGLKLRELDISGSKISSLAVLKGMPLEKLVAASCGIREVNSLSGLSLSYLVLDANPIPDITALRGMPLSTLGLRSTLVSSLDALADMPLQELAISRTRVVDLSPLAALPLKELELQGMLITDVTPLAGLPLTGVDLTASIQLKDVSPLAECLELERLALAFHPNVNLNLNKIRILPHLKAITVEFAKYDYDWDNLDGESLEAFWKWYDSKWGKIFKEK